ncbi:hypothetical protein QZH41_017974, partial [Actinostola sp. cb2023]
SLIIPGCPLERVTKQFQYNTPLHNEFCTAVLPIHEFIEKEFIDKFIKQGEFYAVSTKTCIDTGNCVAVLPTGTLLLSLDKDTYEELGHGHIFVFAVVEIDLKSPSFQPGKNHYERVQWCFKKGLELKYEFVFLWVDEDNQTNTEILQSYFSRYDCHTVRNRESITNLTNLKTPIINPGLTKPSHDITSGCFYEWLGCIQCDIDCCAGTPDSYISTLTCPNPSVVIKDVVRCQWRGFITPQRILKLLETA